MQAAGPPPDGSELPQLEDESSRRLRQSAGGREAHRTTFETRVTPTSCRFINHPLTDAAFRVDSGGQVEVTKP